MDLGNKIKELAKKNMVKKENEKKEKKSLSEQIGWKKNIIDRMKGGK